MLRKYLDKIKPNFEPEGKFHAFRSVYDGFETFLYTPRSTSKSGSHVHDSLDSKRVMIIVVAALVPCLLFGMYNTGYQNFLGSGITDMNFWKIMLYGFLAILPKIIVTYAVGLGIEFIVAQWRGEEIQEGFLVTGILVPLICPVTTPLWMLAVATAFSVIFVKEVFGGTGYNIFNVALVTRAVLFFGYPAQMSGDRAFISADPICGIGGHVTYSDAFTARADCQRSRLRDRCSRPHSVNLGRVSRTLSRVVRRNIDTLCIDWRPASPPDRNSKLENHVLGLRRRTRDGLDSLYLPVAPISRLTYSSDRPACIWRLRVCSRIYGYRSGYSSPNRHRQIYIRISGGCHRGDYPCL